MTIEPQPGGWREYGPDPEDEGPVELLQEDGTILRGRLVWYGDINEIADMWSPLMRLLLEGEDDDGDEDPRHWKRSIYDYERWRPAPTDEAHD